MPSKNPPKAKPRMAAPAAEGPSRRASTNECPGAALVDAFADICLLTLWPLRGLLVLASTLFEKWPPAPERGEPSWGVLLGNDPSAPRTSLAIVCSCAKTSIRLWLGRHRYG